MGRRIKVFEKLSMASAGSGQHIKTLPRAWITLIEISINTAITVSAGTVVVNTSIGTLLVRYNGKQIIRLSGRGYDDKQSAGIECLREVNAQNARLAETSDFFTIHFPEPGLPPGDVQIEWIEQTAQQIGADAAGTVDTGDFDVEVEVNDKPLGKQAIIPYIDSFQFEHTDGTSDFFDYLLSLPFKLRLIAFVTHDSGTRSNTTYAKLTIIFNGVVQFEGKMSKLKNIAQQKSGLALNTGNFLWSPGKGGLKVGADQLLMKFNASSAGTLKFVEGIVFCW